MGWAKYAEDNLELQTDRLQHPMNDRWFPAESYIEVRAVLPVSILPVKVSVSVTASKKSVKPDQILLCRDCGKQFVFTSNDQIFYARKGFHPPKRCRQCRKQKKARLAAQSMGGT